MKKVILFFFTLGIIISLSSIYVKANDTTPTPTLSPTPMPEIDAFTKFDLKTGANYSINAMMNYYHNILNEEQQKIAKFLLGSYNYMYISARGFSYENVNTFEQYVQKFFDVGDLVFGVDNVPTNTSRWGSNFQIYIASIISYAGNVNITFETWLSDVAPHLLIPFSEEWLDAWTTYYNDPSNEGVANFGSETREWTLGNVYPFMFGDYPMGASAQEKYNDFVLNKSPFMWTDVNEYQSQMAISFKDKKLVDTIYVLRSQPGQGLSSYRFGFYDGTWINYNFEQLYLSNYNGVIGYSTGYPEIRYNFDILYTSSPTTIQNLINEAIYTTPFYFYGNGQQYFHNWYYGITHIVLVDNLNTLSNRQDVNNDFSLGLITEYDWIKKPKDTGLPYWWKPIDNEIVIEKPNGDVDPATDDDFEQSIVNNTVINNYQIVAPGVVINVPVDWFNDIDDDTDDYIVNTVEYTLPFFSLVGDVFEVLGDIRIILLGILVLGIVAGVTSKFLL